MRQEDHSDIGITGTAIIATSHISIHTVPRGQKDGKRKPRGIERRVALLNTARSELGEALISFARGVRRYWLVTTVFGLIVAVLDVVAAGPGIPGEDRERVFDRLVRLDEARTRDAGGAGLGLPIARALARAHGGELQVADSERGARLRLTLPSAG